MKIILCIIAVFIIIALWDVIKAILGLAIIIGIAVLIGWGYSLLGYPVWMIWLLVAILAICNPMCLIWYLVRKGKAIKTLRKAAEVSKDINRERDEIIRRIENQISETMVKMGMATDVELYDNAMGDIDTLVEALNKRKRELENRLIKVSIVSSSFDVKEIKQALKIADIKEIFKESLQKLVKSGKIMFEANLNGQDENCLSWDKKLYKSTVENLEPSNMLPAIHLEID